MSGSIVEYAVLAAGLTMLPGVDTALVMRASLTRSRQAGVAVAAGIIAGLPIWGALAGLGASALVGEGSPWLLALRVAGVGYLLWVAFGLIRQPSTRLAEADVSRNGFLQGLGNNLLNPKAAVFYLTVLPQFLPANLPPVAGGLVLAGVHAVLCVPWFAVLILGADRARQRLQDPRLLRRIDLGVAALLVFFAVRLALG